MSKKGTKALASAALMSLVLTTALSAGPVKAASASISRTSGADRYATAAQVAKTNWTTTDNVVLVSGEGYADSVSASALAKKLDAPILLTTSDTLSSDAQSAINQLKPKNIYVIGGNASISQSIRNNLKTNYNLVELGGANRYETNVAVAKQLVQLGVSASDVLVVGGEGFSDALSVAPVAAAKGQILLLANNNEDSIKSVIGFVNDNKSKVTIVGTKNVINDAIYNALGASTRVDGGQDRFATNINVLKGFKDSLKNDKIYVANASAATPDNLYADALVASALAGKYTAPLVLVDKDTSTATTTAEDYIAGIYKDNSSVNVNVIGGTGVISDTLYTAISKAVGLNGGTDVTPEVNSVDTVGLRQVKVVFSQEVDEDTAEDVTNYKVDGTTLVDGDDVAVLQDDNKTVLITLKDARKQSDNVDVTVKKGILSEDKASTIAEFTESVTFNDTTVPTIDSVEVRGNSKITVKFSEPVNVGSSQSASGAYSKFKIDGKNLSSYGLDSTYTQAKDAVKDNDGNYWTNKIEFYFDTELEAGNRTFKVSDGDKSALEDAAGFPIAETTEDINVDTLSTAPEITSITANDDGKVYVNFDRPMDEKTAQEISYYKVNDGNSEVTKAELKKEDTQVKLTVKGLNKGSNKLYIDDNVQDAYGNNVEEDTYKPFELTEDTTKPAVTSIYALDDSTIRVRFNKDVDADYGRNLSNYKLKDSDGTDISSQMASVKVAGDTSSSISSTGSVFDISLGKDSDGEQYKLTDATYTITVKYVQDTASTPNVMDDYETTFDGSDEVNAKVVGVYKVKGENKVTLVFNKEMDSSTLGDESSYEYVNEKGDTKTLPSSADANPSSDNKSVTIDLSDTSLVADGSKSDEYNIRELYATKVKDVNGNSLQVGSQGGSITTTNTGASVKANSLKLYYKNDTGDDLKADVTFDVPINTDGKIDANDFRLGGETPDSATVDGKKVTLTFNNNNDDEKGSAATKINRIKAQGLNAKLEIVGSSTTDVTGNPLTPTTADSNIVPYFYNAAPRTIVVKSGGYATNWTAAEGTNATVNIQFDTPISVNSVKAGDFTFSISGTNVDADRAEVVLDSAGNPTGTVKFTFDSTESKKIVKGDTMTIKPKNTTSTTTISTVKDPNGQFAYYKATNDDSKGIDVVIGEGSATVDKTALNAAVAKAANYKSSDYTADSYKALTDAVAAANALSSDATQAQVDAATKAISDAITALVTVSDTGVELNDVTAVNLGLSYMYEIDYGTVKDSVSSVKFYDAAGTEVTAAAVSLKDGKFTTEDETASIKVFDKDGKQIAHAKVLN